VEFHIHHVKEPARITKIIALLDKTGRPSKSAPRFLKSKQNAVVQVISEHILLCETSFCKSSIPIRFSIHSVSFFLRTRLL
jgi:elongation factor 1 alpha-like protein